MNSCIGAWIFLTVHPHGITAFELKPATSSGDGLQAAFSDVGLRGIETFDHTTVRNLAVGYFESYKVLQIAILG